MKLTHKEIKGLFTSKMKAAFGFPPAAKDIKSIHDDNGDVLIRFENTAYRMTYIVEAKVGGIAQLSAEDFKNLDNPIQDDGAFDDSDVNENDLSEMEEINK